MMNTKKSLMSVKKMIDLYVTYGLDEDTWNMLYNMRCHDLISYDVWCEFQSTAKGWQYDTENGQTIIDTDNDDKVIYRMDDDGYYVKVA